MFAPQPKPAMPSQVSPQESADILNCLKVCQIMESSSFIPLVAQGGACGAYGGGERCAQGSSGET